MRTKNLVWGHLNKITCNISLVITIIGLLILITGTSYANMDVYSAKIYNKALTDEEVLHNYLYEKQTFNLE